MGLKTDLNVFAKLCKEVGGIREKNLPYGDPEAVSAHRRYNIAHETLSKKLDAMERFMGSVFTAVSKLRSDLGQ